MTELDGGVPQRESTFFTYLPLPVARARLYYGAAIGLALWFVGYVFLLAKVLPTAIYWLSYYAVNYSAGFVRRGLAGHITALFPEKYYFPIVYTLMWGSFAVYCASLALVARHILLSGARSERRIVVSLLIPVLPFAVTFAIFGPRPELFAASALLVFGLALARQRPVVITSAVYGMVIAALAFFHELIPIQFTLGAVLAIAVLSPSATPAAKRLGMLAATCPGLVATAIIVAFGRRDVGPQLCAQVPHHLIQNPFQVPPDKIVDYALGRYTSVSDYHDWVCSNILPYFSADVSAWLRSVTSLGAGPLVAGFVHGLVVCVVTLWLIGYFTGVRWRSFLEHIHGGIWLPLVALAMMIPIFATGVDWIRWWTIILINVAGIYLIFAADRAEIEKAVSARQVKVFAAVLIVLAFLPVSAGPGYFSGWIKV